MRAGVSPGDGPRSLQGSRRAQAGGSPIVVWALAAVAVTLATAASWRGPGLTTDSVGYLSTGVNIAQADGLIMLSDQPLTIFPPGVPLIAAAGHASGLGAEAALRITSIASFGAIVLLGARLLRRVTPHAAVRLGATALLAVSPALLGVSKMAWSEPPFIVVTIAFLMALARASDRRDLTWRDVAVLTSLCWIAFMLRYVGMALTAVAGLALLASVRPLGLRALARIAAFGLLSASAPIAWMLRNHAADGTFLGHRSPSQDSVRDVAVRTAATLGEWLVPAPALSTRTLAVIGSAGAGVVLAGLAVAVWRPAGQSSEAGTGSPDPASPTLTLTLCCALFCTVYIGYLSVASLSTSFEPTNSRYLSPAFLPAVAVAAVGATALLRLRPSAAAHRLLLAALVILLASQTGASLRDARDGAADGIGFNSLGWRRSALSEVASGIIESADHPVVYSNSPSGLWAGTRIQPVHWAPRDTGFRGVPTPRELDEFVEKVGCATGDSYLVIHLFGDRRVVSLDRIRSVVDVERVGAAPDGAVFRVSAPAPARCPDELPARVRRT